MNLTSIVSKDQVYLKHFFDSLTLALVEDFSKPLTVCDIGCGAGFPGIVLKIVFPFLSVTLVDSLKKRINFLNIVIEELHLEDIKAYHARIEDFSLTNIELYDIVVSRAVANAHILLELGCQLVKKSGYFIMLKGQIDEEWQDKDNLLKTLNYKEDKIIKFKLPVENSNRSIIKLQKIDKTSQKYPRQFQKIKKFPL